MTTIASVPAVRDTTPLPLRSSTFLGICEGVGEDFGFNANWLRIPLASSVLFSPLFALGAYAALGVAVLASRLLFPNPKPQPAEEIVESVNEAGQELPLAA